MNDVNIRQSYGRYYSNYTTSICCGFVVQQVVQRIETTADQQHLNALKVTNITTSPQQIDGKSK